MTAETQEERAISQRDALIRAYTSMETLADILLDYVEPLDARRLRDRFEALRAEVRDEMGWKR